MIGRTPRRLPGFRFEVQPPPLTEVLPRMDVAVFAGFAASGPLHTPVAVEDIAHFQAIFGMDAPLAWDVERGETVFAFLAPAVRAFFRNGGQRCWIVRVAGPEALANRFSLRNLVQLDEQGNQGAVQLQARSEGSWSDSLEVATVLTSEILTLPPDGQLSSPPDPLNALSALAARNIIAAGDLLRLTFLHAGPHEGLSLLLAVGGASNRAKLEISPGTTLWFKIDDPTSAIPPPATLPFPLSGVERLTFALEVRQGQAASWRLPGLGFVPGHPRYWGDLPTDADLYASLETTAGSTRPLLWDAAADPRLPLAARSGTSGICFPLGMPMVPDKYTGPEQHPTTALERDGLGRFDAALFFDTRDPRSFRSLLEAGAGDLLAEADFQRYQGPAPRALGGIYAALDIEEATLFAVPDAIQRGWSLASAGEPMSPLESSPLARPEWWHFLPCNPPPQIPNVRVPPPGHFLNCNLEVLAAPDLYVKENANQLGSFTLAWSEVPGASYALEEATEPSFVGAVPLFAGKVNELPIYGRGPGDYYYRVLALRAGVSSDYSNGVCVRVAPPSRWHLTPVNSYSDSTLLEVQRALLRLCAARADLFTVLALPEHYHEDDATNHVTRLTSSGGPSLLLTVDGFPPVEAHSVPLGLGEAGSLSYGAIYHPWLMGSEENGTALLRRTPPDGAACGIMARRALARGAWIAPANEFLKGVVALTPAVRRQSWQAWQDTRINLLRQEPHGFVALCADTLSDDPALRPINVRRLLILLRRLALRLGATYVFEPNDDSFHRSVQRGFEAQMEYLFVRGAFAGKTPDASFQVVTDSSLNTPQSIDQGRFLVELRVAPSLPMTFLTIRLVQTGDQGLVTEVA